MAESTLKHQAATPGSVSVASGLDRLAPEWQQLAERTAAPPFTWPGWVGAWSRAFAPNQLELHVHRRNGELTGVLPLLRRGRSLTTPANFHSPVFGAVTGDAGAADELVRAAASAAPVRLELDFLDPDGALAGAARDRDRPDRRLHVESRPGAPVIEMVGSAEEYLASLSRNLRSSIRRSRRRAERAGELRFEVHRDVEPASAAWREFLRLESSGWKADAGTAISSQRTLTRFYEEVLRWGARLGVLRLALTSVDAQPIAGTLAIEAGGAMTVLKTGYDPEWSEVSPGKLNQDDLVAYCHEAGLERLDLGTGEFQHKLRWKVRIDERIVVRSFGRGPGGTLDWVVDRIGRPLARRVLRRPRTHREGAAAGAEGKGAA